MEVAGAERGGQRGDRDGYQNDVLLSIRAIRKAYGGVLALDSVDFDVRAGEIHALVGANGSGKSTLVKILAGVLAPDEGGAVRKSTAAGGLLIAAVHQDLGLFDEGTVAENVLATERDGLFLRPRRERRFVRQLLDELGSPIPAGATIRDLSAEQRVTVAVARALFQLRDEQRAVMIVDEATSVVRGRRAQGLIAVLARLRDRGLGVVFVSHDLDEVLELADRITVLSDGVVDSELRPAETDRDAIISRMLRRSVTAGARSVALSRTPHGGGRAADNVRRGVLRVDDAFGGGVTGLTMAIDAGEIVGLTGVAGSGYDDVPLLIAGATRLSAGTVLVNGKRVRNPVEFAAAGGRVVPSQRQMALVFQGSVHENALLGERGGWSRLGLSRRGRERRWVADLVTRYGVKCASPQARIGALSGGNQQKLIVGRCFEARPDLLVLHEPTQGVDAVVRAELLGLIRSAVSELGTAVLYVSTEIDELCDIADRVVVIRRAVVVGEVAKPELDPDSVHALLY
jgi:ribose transport system ATP-binding protein